MAFGLLTQEQDRGDNESSQNGGGSVAAERKAAMVNRPLSVHGDVRALVDKASPNFFILTNTQARYRSRYGA